MDVRWTELAGAEPARVLVHGLGLVEPNLDPAEPQRGLSSSRGIAAYAEAEWLAGGYAEFLAAADADWVPTLRTTDPRALHRSAVGLVRGTDPPCARCSSASTCRGSTSPAARAARTT